MEVNNPLNHQAKRPVATAPKACTEAVLRQKMKEVFGYSRFRGSQATIIKHVLQGRNTMVIMPTGAGKSLCYQLPSLMTSGTALVISPLIALMKNQIDQLRNVGVSAYFLNSTLSRKEANAIKKEVEQGKARLLYIAPESLAKEDSINFFKRCELSFVAVDEAHCISEWGHDFRPEYRRIREIIKQIGQIPVIALTATATPKVQLDIQKNLSIEQAKVFRSSFNRPNLFYEVEVKKDSRKRLVGFLREKKGDSGIIYCLTRKKVEAITEMLKLNGIEAVSYHAGLDAKTRIKNQDDFLSKRTYVIVATVAFGMGIDKPDVRFVVHYDVPKSLEGYYQETGRAGRDGQAAHCLMLFSQNDINKIEKFNKNKPLYERDNTRMLLEEVTAYAESPICRRAQLLLYFGERYNGSCRGCDNCLRSTPRFKATDELLLILEAVDQTKPQNSLSYVANIISGNRTDPVRNRKHEKLSVFGKGKDKDEVFWNALLRQAICQDFLSREFDSAKLFESLKITEKGKQFLESPDGVYFQNPHIYPKTRSEEIEEGLQREVLTQYSHTDEDLLADLIQLQKKTAKEAQVPAYVVFLESSLEEMSVRYPTTTEEMLQIQGVGQGKMRKYGQPFLNLIKKYVRKHNIKTSSSVLMKSAGLHSRTKINIIRQVDKKIRLEDIAESLGIPFYELLTEMENICYSGTRLSLGYHINCMLEKDRQKEIYNYFLESETDDMNKACKELSDYNEEEIRLMRIQFVSEMAN